MVTLSAFGHIAQMTRLCSIPLPKGRRDDNLGNYTERSQTKLSSRPETWPRVRLSVRERRMKCTNATKVNRKSGGSGVEGSAVRPSGCLNSGVKVQTL